MKFPEFDLVSGDLPPWLTNFVSIARPLFVAGNVAIPVLGAFTVGLVSFIWPVQALTMVDASTKFLQGIPDAAYGMITALALGYIGAKSWETVKAPPPPKGRKAPEANVEQVAVYEETPEFVQDAPTEKGPPPWTTAR